MIPLSTSSTQQLFLTFPILAPRLQTPHVMVASIRRLIMTGRLLGTAARGPLAILQHWRARRAMHLPRLMSKASKMTHEHGREIRPGLSGGFFRCLMLHFPDEECQRIALQFVT